MLYIFVAVLAVLLVLNFFMLMVLRQMMGATGRQIERDAGRLFGMYDEMLEEKSRKLEELRQEEETLKARLLRCGTMAGTGTESPAISLFPAPPASPAEFQDRDFTKLYGKVKTAFSVSPEEMAQAFQSQMKQENGGAALKESRETQAVREMREALDFESLYQLLILSKEEQRQVLDAAFGEEPVYKAWAGAHPTGGAAAFCSWLDGQLKEAEETLVVKVSKEAALGEKAPLDGVVWQEDPSICEGVKILYKNRLYDYSV